jgi:hypothetical protein
VLLSTLGYYLLRVQSQARGNLVEDHHKPLLVLVDKAEDLVFLLHLRTTKGQAWADGGLIALGQLRVFTWGVLSTSAWQPPTLKSVQQFMSYGYLGEKCLKCTRTCVYSNMYVVRKATWYELVPRSYLWNLVIALIDRPSTQVAHPPLHASCE